MRKGKFLQGALALTLALTVTACNGSMTSNSTLENALSYDDAVTELNTFVKKIDPKTTTARLDVDMDNASVADSLADISTFDLVLEGSGQINIEIAAPSEFSGSSYPDEWLVAVGKKFNEAGYTVDGQSVSVSIRKISSGETLTYITSGGYQPDLYIPSNEMWGDMLVSSGVSATKLTDRIAGNTAGILMSKDVYNTYKEKYGDVTVDGVLKAAIAGDLVFAYTNPYTSATGMNILCSMLHAFDSSNPLSDSAVDQLVQYQNNAPTAAYTTSILKESAAKGIIDAMVMEEQTYINTPELKDYVYTPAGVRHDHPVYSFGWTDDNELEVANLFVEYCQNSDSQNMAKERGFNLHEDYVSEDYGMSGSDYLSAQKVWKTNKNGTRPTIAVFVTDVSGSMSGTRINALRESLLNTMQYIDSNSYIGLVSYSDKVYINLPIGQFDNKQRAYFSGAVKDLELGGQTATYDAVLVGMKMLIDASEEIPNANLMLFVLSDGAQNAGYELKRITPIVGGLGISVYTIGYEMTESDKKDLQTLSSINEAVCIDASSDDIVNELRNLFNVNM
ncbi:Ca-activated chloride channel family protein [Butyrivibrio fibrisolvens DSM 3071]|uniref:Ca-activated chloride channel family protein n=1 Tax=Butyrivibrio fibrisolvens DSM 3071 TaxID=1121131 RepID=A0A1M6FCX1_BUTFI|nr:VWA domain-containing protein [Butyrivibrio fibrisolvens]SHI95531.1 Ca-activated chloride channel family protein [Butyrivibrio fibrisolvens DSM 3071]